MTDDRLARALDECLARIAAGESVASCLASFPEIASDLEPLLVTARRAVAAPPASLGAERRSALRADILGQIATTRARNSASRWRHSRWLLGPAVAVAVLAAVLFVPHATHAPETADAAS